MSGRTYLRHLRRLHARLHDLEYKAGMAAKLSDGLGRAAGGESLTVGWFAQCVYDEVRGIRASVRGACRHLPSGQIAVRRTLHRPGPELS